MNFRLIAAVFFGLALGAVAPAAAELGSFECRGADIPKAQAEAIVSAVQSAYGRMSTLKARFIQESYLAALDTSERSSGAVWFQKPGRMKWEYEAPEKQTFLVRDTTVWLHQPEANQVMIDEFRKVLISDLPVAFLMGIGSLTNDFLVASACPGSAGTVLHLQPKGSAAGDSLKTFILLVDEARAPIGAKVTDVGGNVTAIVLAELRPNGAVDEKMFQPEFPRGTDINDHRQKKGA